MERGVLVQRSMSPRLIIVGGICAWHAERLCRAAVCASRFRHRRDKHRFCFSYRLRRQSSCSAVSDRCPGSRFFFGRGSDQTVTLRLLAGKLAYAAQRFSFFSRRLLRWLLVKSSTLHFAEDAFRCIFFFNTLRAWSILLSRTSTCTG
jgi:hypothetical protein